MQKEQPLTEIRLELNTCNYSASGTFVIYRQPSNWNLRYISTTFILQRSLYIDNLHTGTFVTYRQLSYCNLRYISTTFILQPSLYIDNLHTAIFVTYRQPSYCNLRYISTTFILQPSLHIDNLHIKNTTLIHYEHNTLKQCHRLSV